LAMNLEKASLLSFARKSIFYNRAGLYEDAIRVLEEGYKNHGTGMYYAFVLIELENLDSHSKFREIARKMDLPI